MFRERGAPNTPRRLDSKLMPWNTESRGQARRLQLVRSGDLPVGLFCVESALQKYFGFHPPQIISRTFAIPPTEGRIAIVTDAARDAVDAAAFCARRDRRAGRKICERSKSVRTRDVA